MASIRAILLVNTKKHAKGTEVEVSAKDLADNPHYYRALTDVQADEEAAAKAAAAQISSGERHRQMKAQLAAENELLLRKQAEIRSKQAEADSELARLAKEQAERVAREGEQARRIAELEAEKVRLEKALAEQKRAEAKVLELRPAKPAEEAPPTEQPIPGPIEQPKQAPHLRKRD